MSKTKYEKQNKDFINAATDILCSILDTGNWTLLNGLDPGNRVWDTGDEIVKVTRLEKFYAMMQIDSLTDIHTALAPLRVAPRLERIVYRDPFIVAVYEKLKCEGKPSAAEIGESLAKAHQALADLPIRKSFPWVGFYGEPNEFRFLIPLIKDRCIRSKAELLLEKVSYRPHTEPVHYIHRDLNPGNILKTSSGVYLIDWDMSHGGHREDDVAMSICCLASMVEGEKTFSSFCKEFLNGYRRRIPAEWAVYNSPTMVSAIALAGLRQAVSGWFSDKGCMEGLYWTNILKRLDISMELCMAKIV